MIITDVSSIKQNCFSLTIPVGVALAGFTPPLDDGEVESINLNRELMPNPHTTFIMRAVGESMQEAGILSGDLLIVDKSLMVRDGAIVIAVVDGSFVVKRFRKRKDKIWLQSDNSKFADITEAQEGIIWGIVTYIIHSVNR